MIEQMPKAWALGNLLFLGKGFFMLDYFTFYSILLIIGVIVDFGYHG